MSLDLLALTASTEHEVRPVRRVRQAPRESLARPVSQELLEPPESLVPLGLLDQLVSRVLQARPGLQALTELLDSMDLLALPALLVRLVPPGLLVSRVQRDQLGLLVLQGLPGSRV